MYKVSCTYIYKYSNLCVSMNACAATNESQSYTIFVSFRTFFVRTYYASIALIIDTRLASGKAGVLDTWMLLSTSCNLERSSSSKIRWKIWLLLELNSFVYCNLIMLLIPQLIQLCDIHCRLFSYRIILFERIFLKMDMIVDMECIVNLRRPTVWLLSL